MTDSEYKAGQEIIRRVAKSRGKTAEEVRREMKSAIEAAYAAVKGSPAWKDFPDGPPEPEEFIFYVSSKIKSPFNS